MAYSDVEAKDSSMASTLQQMSMSFGLAGAMHHAFLTLGIITCISSITFSTLHPHNGESVSLAKTEQI